MGSWSREKRNHSKIDGIQKVIFLLGFRDFIIFLIYIYRFRTILSSFHITNVNPTLVVENQDRTKRNPLWRVKWLIDFFNRTWRKVYMPGCFLSMDEFMIPTKIRHWLKQYIKGKPHKWGFKLYMSCCSNSGFCCHFQIHNGKQKTTLAMVNNILLIFSIFFFFLI